MKISNARVRYHRNGISGEGFYTVAFTQQMDGRNRQLVAVAFEGEGRVAVTDPMDAGACFRGDEYEAAIREAIAAAWDDPRTFGGHPCPIAPTRTLDPEQMGVVVDMMQAAVERSLR